MNYFFKLLLLLFAMVLSPPDAGFAQSSATSKQTLENRLETAYDLHMSGKEQESLDIYKDVLDDDSDNLDALWNTAVLHAKIGYRKESEQEMKEHFETAVALAERAVENHPESGYGYYAMAVATGRLTKLMGTGDRIDASRKVKKNIEKASELIPGFAPVWHLYGVWHSDVANMSGAVKAAAGLFSSGIPDASNEKAEEYLKKAISMDKDNILFHLDLAKHYLKVEQPEKAKQLLEEILTIEPQMKDDPGYVDEAKELLENG